MKKIDPAIERVRDARRAISAACEHDPEKLVAYYLRRQLEREQKRQAQMDAHEQA